MQLNSIFFPAPKSTYSKEQLKGELIWIPHFKKTINSHSPLKASPNLIYAPKLNISNGSMPIKSSKNIENKSKMRIQSINTIREASWSSSMTQREALELKKPFMPNQSVSLDLNTGLSLYQQGKDELSSREFDSAVSHNIIEEPNDLQEVAKKRNVEAIKNGLDAPLIQNYEFMGKCDKANDPLNMTSIISKNDGEFFSSSDEDFPINSTQPKSEFKFFKKFSKFSQSKSFDITQSISTSNMENYESVSALNEGSTQSGSINHPNFFVKSDINSTHKKKSIYPFKKSISSSYQDHRDYNNNHYYHSKSIVASNISNDNFSKLTDNSNFDHNPKFFENGRLISAMNLTNRLKKMSTQSAFPMTTNIDQDECLLRPSVSILPTQSPIKLVGSYRESIDFYIPCLYLKSKIKTTKLILYFHGNGEDLKLAYDFLNRIRIDLMINVMAIEYPGYGIYEGTPDDNKILQDADYVYYYLTQMLNIQSKNIIIFGRSIGSGPATWLASRNQIGGLVLMSAFTSIRGVVKDIAGSFVQYFVKERFNNMEWISSVRAPVFLVHGKKDNLISHTHSILLKKACKAKCEIILPTNMDHIELDFYRDFIHPLRFFLKKHGLAVIEEINCINIPFQLFNLPNVIKY